MTEQSLTPRDRVILFALLAVAEEVSNKDLAERTGFRLDGAARTRLNERKYVNSEMVGRAYQHQITSEGRSWCLDEMQRRYPERSDSGTRGLYTVLATLGRYLDEHNVKLETVFVPTSRPLTDDGARAIESKIRLAYDKLADEPGDWVQLAELRSALTGTSRQQVDAVLLRLSTADGVNIVPAADQRSLTPEERRAAVSIGGQDKHLITIREP